MNILKFGRGDFFGIIIPGAFLVLNLVLLFPDEASGLAKQIPHEWAGEDAAIFVGLVVVSYMLGFALRLIRPSYLEVIGYPLHVTEIIIKPLFQSRKNKKADRWEAFWKTVRQKAQDYWEPFPYVDWLYSSYFPMSGKTYCRFFNALLEREFDGDKDRMKRTRFINQCKIAILEHSKALADEIMFSEGLVRFLSGMTCALIFSLIVAAARHSSPVVVWGYLLLAALFLYRLRFIRTKEVAAVFTAFACLGGVFRESLQVQEPRAGADRVD